MIPIGVIALEAWAFFDCKRLATVKFSENSQLSKIGEHCFEQSGIEEIEFPSGVGEIEQCAFQGCKKLKRVVFEKGSSLEAIGINCFSDSGLEEV